MSHCTTAPDGVVAPSSEARPADVVEAEHRAKYRKEHEHSAWRMFYTAALAGCCARNGGEKAVTEAAHIADLAVKEEAKRNPEPDND